MPINKYHNQTITIDTREVKLLELFKQANIHFETANLPIGDIILKHTVDLKQDDDTLISQSETRQITYEFIIERKCVLDMIASIKDGRYREQKIRLLAECKNTTRDRHVIIVYIIEGTPAELRLSADKTMLSGSLISSIFRDKIPVLRTYSLQDTFDLLVRMNDRLVKDYADFFTSTTSHSINQIENPVSSQYQEDDNGSGNGSGTADTTLSQILLPTNDIRYLAAIKKNKKDNMTPAMWNMNCLCGIPGVSSSIAIKIAEKFPSIRALLEAYQACTDSSSKETLLADIILTETDKQRRRIGNVISKRVYEYFQHM